MAKNVKFYKSVQRRKLDVDKTKAILLSYRQRKEKSRGNMEFTKNIETTIRNVSILFARRLAVRAEALVINDCKKMKGRSEA